MPHEQLSGKDQLYCLMDLGLSPPIEEIVTKIKRGSYVHVMEWDGRNWTGPSDTGNRKGNPFPAGTYELKVTLKGKLESDKGKTPYEITAKTKLVLK